MQFNGNGQHQEVAHEDALARTSGTVAFSFVADRPGQGNQTLFSKDASGYVDGGHLTAWIKDNGEVKVRYQSDESEVYLYADDIDIVAGREYHFAFSFDDAQARLYLDGTLQDVEDLSDRPGFELGMSGNTESLVFGASTTTRSSGELNNLKDFFDGTISDVVVADRALRDVEVLRIQLADGDFTAVGLDSSHPSGTAADLVTAPGSQVSAEVEDVVPAQPAPLLGTEAGEAIQHADDAERHLAAHHPGV